MVITVMSMSPGLRNVLDILAELAHNDTETDVFESNIILQSGGHYRSTLAVDSKRGIPPWLPGCYSCRCRFPL